MLQKELDVDTSTVVNMLATVSKVPWPIDLSAISVVSPCRFQMLSLSPGADAARIKVLKLWLWLWIPQLCGA